MLLPDEWDVCGVTVPSLSVWHTFALENIGNRYLCGGPCDRDDAAGLLLFAKHDMAGGRRLMQPQRVNFRKRETSKIHGILKKMDFKESDAACLEYVETCLRTVGRYEGKGKPSGAPYQFQIVRVIALGNPSQLETAWNMPYAQARCMYDAYAESEGDKLMMTPAAQRGSDLGTWADKEDQPDKEEVA